ncbi:MAG: S49 family peptidase [Chlamydiia bacterium]|nr:S49 family peptidase [Chlamydiia bacterium]
MSGDFMEFKRESIFISAVRSLCNTFAGMIGIIIGVVILGIVIAMFSSPSMVSERTEFIIAPDAKGNRHLLPHKTPAILRLNIHGVIGSRNLNAKTLETQLYDSREGLLQNDRVHAVLLHINSPGGTAFDAHDMYRSLVEYKKRHNVPIYAFVDGLCASGGMMIACAADKIYSNPIGVIGSVGVLLGPNFNVAGFMDKYGVKELTLTKGIDKDALSPFRPWKPGEEAMLKDIVDYDYNVFVDLVSSARPKLTKEKLMNVYGARVYDPIKAEEYGYIDDGKSSYSAALTALVDEAKIDEDYQVVELKVIHPVFSDLIDGNSSLFAGKLRHEHRIAHQLPDYLTNRPLYLYSPALQWIDDK